MTYPHFRNIRYSFDYFCVTWHIIIRNFVTFHIKCISLLDLLHKRIVIVVSFHVSCPLLHFFPWIHCSFFKYCFENSKGWYNSMYRSPFLLHFLHLGGYMEFIQIDLFYLNPIGRLFYGEGENTTWLGNKFFISISKLLF
jgi:hypothetical protein